MIVEVIRRNNETQRRKDAKEKEMEEDEISYKVIGAAIEVHKTLGGPGLLEGVYESCLYHELSQWVIKFLCVFAPLRFNII